MFEEVSIQGVKRAQTVSQFIVKSVQKKEDTHIATWCTYCKTIQGV